MQIRSDYVITVCLSVCQVANFMDLLPFWQPTSFSSINVCLLCLVYALHVNRHVLTGTLLEHSSSSVFGEGHRAMPPPLLEPTKCQ